MRSKKYIYIERGSNSKTNPGDDGVQVLDLPFQHHHPGSLFARLTGMVQHHIQKVLELGGDALVLKKLKQALKKKHSVVSLNSSQFHVRHIRLMCPSYFCLLENNLQ